MGFGIYTRFRRLIGLLLPVPHDDRAQTQSIVERLYTGTAIQVISGPFQGMACLPRAHGSQLLPKLIGSYEEPIHPWIRDTLGTLYDAIVDVGCAEGYYVVGLARAHSLAQLYAIDTDPLALHDTRELAALNGVGKRVHGFPVFNAPLLAEVHARHRRVLLFVDVEGAETQLLALPGVERCDIIVELHDCFRPGISDAVIERLHPTHHLTLVVDHPWREPVNLGGASQRLDAGEQAALYDERRPARMRWLRALKRSPT